MAPAKRRAALYERVVRAGCAVSELPGDCSGRRWGQLASERIVVELAELCVLVEAEDSPAQLMRRTLGARAGADRWRRSRAGSPLPWPAARTRC